MGYLRSFTGTRGPPFAPCCKTLRPSQPTTIGQCREDTSAAVADLDDPRLANSVRAGAPRRIRTRDLRVRSPALYPAELEAHS